MSEWISVEDRLPEFGMKVLVYWRPINDNPYARALIIAERSMYGPPRFSDGADLDSPWWWANGQYYDTETFITHWMPLPEPPDE